MRIYDNKNREFYAIGFYNDSAYTGICVVKMDNERLEYIEIQNRKKHCKKIYYSNIGEPYIIRNGSRLYLSEIGKIF